MVQGKKGNPTRLLSTGSSPELAEGNSSQAERFTLLNRVPSGKFNRVNSEPVNVYTEGEKFNGIYRDPKPIQALWESSGS